jgi:putative transposase
LGLKRSTYYRLRKPVEKKQPKPRPTPRRALTSDERQAIIAVLHEERFMDKAPAEIYATLLDEGRYLCSIRTMYRILTSLTEVRERRNQLRHPEYKKPELLATAPNQVWSWDITKIKGPVKWTYYYLYVILDIFSRYAVGWMVATRETAELAKALIAETCMRQGIDRSQLIIHSDRGAPMKSKAVALLLADLGVGKSFNRPHVSNDNPYSEAHFKTLKDRPLFPDRFGSIQDARALCRQFFEWYNNEHYHGGIALMTPSVVHYGKAQECNAARQSVLSAAHAAHSERFVRGEPKTIPLPLAAWINKPVPASEPLLLTLVHAEDCEIELQ